MTSALDTSRGFAFCRSRPKESAELAEATDGPTAHFVFCCFEQAQSNSPPFWMTKSGSVTGSHNCSKGTPGVDEVRVCRTNAENVPPFTAPCSSHFSQFGAEL